ncbi:MAG: alkaline shock response membrane anchor protein AmaP [Pseudonocardia sp.]
MTIPVELTKPEAPELEPTSTPAPRPATLRKRARSAVARSAAGDRSLTVLIGLTLLAAGTLVALLSYGVFGRGRSRRTLLDPVIVDALRAQPLLARLVALAAGLLLLGLGLVWAARSLRPERRPDVIVDGGADTAIVVSSSAAADAVAAQAGALRGVGHARARFVGTDAALSLRVTLWLAEDADIRDVLARLDDQVLTTARTSLGLAALPVAVRLELDSSTPHPRVA